jgi:hypothetical protein
VVDESSGKPDLVCLPLRMQALELLLPLDETLSQATVLLANCLGSIRILAAQQFDERGAVERFLRQL